MVATLVDCCARAESGHAAPPPSRAMKSRRRIASPKVKDKDKDKHKHKHKHRSGFNRQTGSG
jgi:hypothetical protein